MFRKAIFCLAVFMFGIISSQDLFVPAIEDKGEFTIEINGNLSINTEINTNNEIMHQQIDNEPLKSFINVEGIINYSIGARNSRDRLVASGGQNQSWPTPHNVNIQLTYPQQGYGALVTYVAIIVNQTSSLGKAYVVQGGINQHMISIVVEAYNTYVFNVQAYVYGI